MIMNAIGDLNKALALYSEPGSRTLLPRFLAVVQTYWRAALDGLAAARAYHALTAQGETHQAAVEKVFDRHLGSR
jgi:hypothetical protein